MEPNVLVFKSSKPGFSMGDNKWVEFLEIDYEATAERIKNYEELKKQPVFTPWQPAEPVIEEEKDIYETTDADRAMIEYLNWKADRK
jgi:hypothetical protein